MPAILDGVVTNVVALATYQTAGCSRRALAVVSTISHTQKTENAYRKQRFNQKAELTFARSTINSCDIHQ